MASTDWSVEILYSWDSAARLRDEWNELVATASDEHPYISSDWFHFWYPSFVPKDSARIMFLRQGDGTLRAILPGYVETRKIGKFPVRCFCYAANGYSPYGDVIARAGDLESIGRAVMAAVKHLRPAPHLLILPSVWDRSDTAAVIRGGGLRGLGRRIEHTEEVPFISMPTGWADYLAGRSSNTRRRLKQSHKRSSKLGQVHLEEFATAERSAELIDRMRQLDARTWQGRQGTGLFSTPENERFYTGLLSFRYPKLLLRVSIITIGGKDAAYYLTFSAGTTCHGYKTGYDPEFAACSPGALMMAYTCQSSVREGLKRVDLGAGLNEYKEDWETGREGLSNWWLFNRYSLRGCALEFMVRANDLHKGKRSKPGCLQG